MEVLEVQEKVIPQIKKLISKDPESISFLEKNPDGWTVHCDVLEKKSVPETYDLLKILEFKLDKNANITSFKQLRKVRRGDLG